MANEMSKDEDFNSFIQKNIKTVAEGIKRSQTLPIGPTRTNFLSCYPNFKDEMEPFSEKLLSMMSTLLKKENVRTDIRNCDSEGRVDLMVDGVNKILDRVRDNLNELKGLRKKPITTDTSKLNENISGSWNRKITPIRWKEEKTLNKFIRPLNVQKVLEKPQLKFEVKIDNSNTPFQPRLMSKPNAKKPLSVYIETSPQGIDHYCHPYMHELNRFKLSEEQLKVVDPIYPGEIKTGNVKYVNDVASLNEMVESLKKMKELAVDLEGHQFRSYQGLTCLMQVSTRKVDYIVDTLALRSQLHILNEVFTDPNVVKVFHGAGNDVLWLQRDFNLYVVNMFDTHIASLVLNYPKLSLAYLLKEYCNIDTDKRYQLYDWRIRPLPEDALTYARCDTHYLLYIYDRLRNDLLEKGNGSTRLLETVYSRSVEICKKRYEKMTCADDHLSLYKQSKQNFDNRQQHALRSLYLWRDDLARKEDESTGFVLPNHMLLQIAEVLPREMQGILACCNPIPALVRKNLSHLHQLICIARNQPVNKMAIKTDGHLLMLSTVPVLSKLRCPHDFSHHDDFRDNLATLIDGSDVIQVHEKSTIKPSLTIFCDDDENEKELKNNDEYLSKMKKFEAIKFVSPYERYKRTALFAEATANKLNALKSSHKTELEKIEICHEFKLPAKLETNDMTPISVEREPVESAKTTRNDIAPETGSKRKLDSVTEELPNKKLARDYDSVADSIKKKAACVELKNDGSSNKKEDAMIANNETSTATATRNKKRVKKIKYKSKPKDGANDSSNLTSVDYTKANFNKFLTSGPKNLKKLLNSKISFGANKKNNNKKYQVKRGRR